MFFKQLRDIAKPQWFEIIKRLKRSVGLSVAELAEAMGMSYMGVKGHCVELEKKGYLDTWRRPKEVGRPEMAYRLTAKAAALFPEVGAEFSLDLLESIAATGGDAAAEKLLFNYFIVAGERYAKRISGEGLVARARALARIRDAEGYVSEFVPADGSTGAMMIEHHSLHAKITARFPSADRMEDAMIARVIGVPVNRREERASGLYRVVFHLG